jgi:hypothetical protein
MTPVKVLHGHPTPEELAAVLAVVAARAAAAASAATADAAARDSDERSGRGGGRASAWSDHEAALRRMPRPGPYAWRTSGWAR